MEDMAAHSMVRNESLWTEFDDSPNVTEAGKGWFGMRIRNKNTGNTAFICLFTDHRGDGTMPDQDDLPDINEFDFILAKFPASLRDGVHSLLERSELTLCSREYPLNGLMEYTWTELDFVAERIGLFGCLGAWKQGTLGSFEKLDNGVVASIIGATPSDADEDLLAIIPDSNVNAADLIATGAQPFESPLSDIDVIVGLWMQNTAVVNDAMERAAQMIDYRHLPPRPSKIASSVAPTYSHAAHTPVHASENGDTEDDELSIMVTRLDLGDGKVDKGTSTKRVNNESESGRKRPRVDRTEHERHARARTYPRTRARTRELAHAHSHMDTNGGGAAKTVVYTTSFVVTAMCTIVATAMCALTSGSM